MALLLLLLTSLSLSPAIARFPTTHTPPPPPIDFSRTSGILIAVFLTAIFFLALFTIYMRFWIHRDNNTPVTDRPAPRPRRGLEDSAIEDLPAVVYSDVKDHKIGRNALECAVCLSEFEDHETLKLLPKCDHVFHSDCIATWLSAHVTCPVCRFDLSARDEVVVEPEVELTFAPVDPEVVRAETPTRTPPVVESSPRRRSPIDFGRLGSMSLWSFRAWRSRSARPGRYWTEEERGRFTLRLPESMRRELLAGRMRRSASVAGVFAGEGSGRRGYRVGGNGGRSLKLSDRWSFITRNLSLKGGEGSVKREGGMGPSRTRSIGDGRGPLNCLGGGGGGGDGDRRSDDERSTVAFATV